MNGFLRVAAVLLLVALGMLASRSTVGSKRAFDAVAANRDAPRGRVSAELPPETRHVGAARSLENLVAKVDPIPDVALTSPTSAALPLETPPASAERSLGNLVAKADPMPVGAVDPARPPSGVAVTPPSPPPELERFAAAAALYRKGDRKGADGLTAQISDPLQRAALEWVALRTGPDRDRLAAFAASHKDWPAADWMRDLREGWLYSDHAPAATVAALFAQDPPRTPAGILAAARAAIEAGRKDEATRLVRGLWRDSDLDAATEGNLLKEFGALLNRADHKYRADRLLYAENVGAALRAARLAGADVVALQSGAEQVSHFRLAQEAGAAGDADGSRAGPIGGVQFRRGVFGQADDLLAGKGGRLAQAGSRGQTKQGECRGRRRTNQLIQENAGAIHFGFGDERESGRLAAANGAGREHQDQS